MKKLITALTGTALWLASFGLSATTIEVLPSSQNETLGSPVSVEVSISGLGVSSTPSLGVYDIDVNFDPGLLALSSVEFASNSELGGMDLFGLGTDRLDTPGAGTVNVFELSLDSASDLDDFQLDAFTLFTLTFDTVGTGTSSIGLVLNAVGDSLGIALDPVVSVDGEVTIDPSAPVLPIPATLWLFTFALGLFGCFGKRKITA